MQAASGWFQEHLITVGSLGKEHVAMIQLVHHLHHMRFHTSAQESNALETRFGTCMNGEGRIGWYRYDHKSVVTSWLWLHQGNGITECLCRSLNDGLKNMLHLLASETSHPQPHWSKVHSHVFLRVNVRSGLLHPNLDWEGNTSRNDFFKRYSC